MGKEEDSKPDKPVYKFSDLHFHVDPSVYGSMFDVDFETYAWDPGSSLHKVVQHAFKYPVPPFPASGLKSILSASPHAPATSFYTPGEAAKLVEAITGKVAKLVEDGTLFLAEGGDLSGPPLGSVPNVPHVPGAGQTISEAAKVAEKAAGGEEGAWPHGFGHNAHVKTVGGEKLFHEPIGALIIAHGHIEHDQAHAAPTAKLAEQAVQAGTHKYVQSGSNTYAVAKNAETYVPKTTDIHDEGAVKNTTKVVVGQHNGVHSHAVLHPGMPKYASVVEHTPHTDELLQKNWKKLPQAEPKKPVSLKGQHAGWVPHDWTIYKGAGLAEENIHAKFAKAPDGTWYWLKGGEPEKMSDKNSQLAKQWAASGKLAEEKAAEAPGHPEPGAVPHLPKEGAEPAKADIGGVPVTHEEIKSAIHHLETAQSTNVKGPLKSKGHPLAEMDYMKVAKEELAKHPELKVPSGTKTKHVGQVKLAVLHHLHAQAAKLASNQAEEKAAAEGTKATEEAAAHAQELTGAVAEFPKEAQPEEPPGELFYDGKKGPDSWPKYELVNAANWADHYWNEVFQDGHKEKVTGEVPTVLTPVSHNEAGKKSGADLLAEMKAEHGDVYNPKSSALPPEAPKAAPVGVVKSPSAPQSWGGVEVTTGQLQQAAGWLEETAKTHGSFKAAMKKLGNPMADADYMGVAAAWKKANPESAKGLNTKQLMLAHVNELLSSMTKAEEESGFPQAAELHDLLSAGHIKSGWTDGADGAASLALQMAVKFDKPYYAKKNDSGLWSVTQLQPPLVKHYILAKPDNTLYMHSSGLEDYQYAPEKVLALAKKWLSTESGKEAAEAAPAPDTMAQQPQEPGKPDLKKAAATAKLTKELLTGKTEVDNGTATYPKYAEYDQIHAILSPEDLGEHLPTTGSHDQKDVVARQLWMTWVSDKTRYAYTKEEGGIYYIATSPPNAGSWGAKTEHGFLTIYPNHVVVGTDNNGDTYVWSGAQVLALVKEKFPPPAPEPEQGTAGVWVAGKKVADTPAGSKVYTGIGAVNPASGAKFVKFPDGSWHQYMPSFGAAGYVKGEVSHYVMPPGNGENLLAEGGLKEVTGPEAEGKTLFTQGGHEYWAEPGTTAWKPADYPDLGIYLRQADGAWLYWNNGYPAPKSGTSSTAATMEQQIQDGKLAPYGIDAEHFAQAVGAAKSEVKPETPEPAELPVPKDQQVSIEGDVVGTVPADAKVYWYSIANSKGEDGATAKYIKFADGHWEMATHKGIYPSMSYDSYLGTGFWESGQKPHDLLKPAEPEKLESPKAEEPQQPAGEPIPAIYKGNYSPTIVGEFPAGSKLYESVMSYDKAIYAKAPDGTWYKTYGTTVQAVPGGPSLDSSVEGVLEPVAPPTTQEVQQIKDYQALAAKLQTSSAGKPKFTDPAGNTWQHALAWKFALGKNSDATITKTGSGTFDYGFGGGDNAEYWTVKWSTLTGTHHLPGGTTEDIPFSEVQQALNDWLVPNSVLINGKPHKFGFYYKPKGKAYLEIKEGNGFWNYKEKAAGKATYVWHDTKGGKKDVSAKFAAEHLASEGIEYYTVPKQATAETGPLKKVSYATVEHPGHYQMWGANGHVMEDQAAEIHADGSKSLYAAGSTVPLPDSELGQKAWDSMLGDGEKKIAFLLDSYHTSVVRPGLQPETYVVFGNQLGRQEVADLLQAITEHYQSGWQQDVENVLHFNANPGVKTVMSQFFSDKLEGQVGVTQRDAIMGLLRELLLVPQQPSGTDLSGGAEVKFLKGLPPGINTAKDVFSWASQGYAKPFDGSTDITNFDSTELADKIKAVSASFGDGKVVGTHVSALTKAQKVKWVESWKKGDMQEVFLLDAQGGKVSPAHPGAPGNAATHHITWSPWDPSQVPAAKDVEGDWTDLSNGITLPKAEVGNYLIKAGLQHPEYLTDSERRSWVIAHRNHDQDQVDEISRLASTRWAAGGPQLTQPPSWTHDIKPATLYDTYLEEKTPAASWGYKALEAFIEDHKAEVAPFIQQLAQKEGFDPEYLPGYHRDDVVQMYLDDQHAKYVAEQSKPVWSKTPGATPPSSSHPIVQLTQTIPYTGETSQWMYKVVPGSEKFLAEQENAANALANAWGFRTPTSQVLEFEGQYGQVQRRLDAVGDLSYGKPLGFYDAAPVPWGELTQKQVSDIAREHPLDWVLDNDDGRASNFMRMQDGSVVGVDKGRVWIDLGHWKGLSGDSQADERSAQVVTQLYNAIRSHDISKDVADQAYIDVIQRARKMASLSDDRLRNFMEQGLANRKKFGTPGSKEALISAVTGRKNSLDGDFGKLWAQVYKDAGWELPEVPVQKLPPLPDGTQLHSGFSEPDFLDHVEQVGAYGVPAFFGGTELAESHFIVWREFEGTGKDNPLWWGESTARGEAYDKLVTWAKAHQNSAADLTGSYKNQFADVGNIKGEKAVYDQIIAAAKTVSHHASDKAYNTEKMNGLEDARVKLKDWQLTAQAKLNAPGHESDLILGGSKPAPVLAMATYYLELVGRVDKAKEKGTTFAPGDLPRWEAPKDTGTAEQKTDSPVKVQVATPYRPHSVNNTVAGYPQPFSPEDGQLHTSTQKNAIGESSKVWRISLPTGEEIELSDGKEHGVELAYHGRVRFRTRAGDAASFERVRAQLQDMGLNMHEAEDHDMELYYWRHLAETLADRVDGRTEGSKYWPVWTTLQEELGSKGLKPTKLSSDQDSNIAMLAGAGLTPSEELAVWHKAWAAATSDKQVNTWVDKQGYLPRFGRFDIKNPSRRAGKPFWYRFDVSRDQIAKWEPFSHGFQTDSSTDAMKILRSGALLSREERFRALALDVSGMDNPASAGATAYIYTRLHQSGSAHVLFSPKALARTTNYAWDQDFYGKTWLRKEHSYFDPKEFTKYHGSSNETMVANALTLLDDIELVQAYSSAQRDEMISELKAAGINFIRGLPVEQRIVTSITHSDIKALQAAYIAHPELLDPLIELGLDSNLGLTQHPAYAEEVSVMASAMAEAVSGMPAALAGMTANVTAQVDMFTKQVGEALSKLDALAGQAAGKGAVQ